MGKVIEFQRQSLTEMLESIKANGPTARGVIAITMRPDGHVSFRISGFTENNDSFVICGLLDWIKADLLSDFT